MSATVPDDLTTRVAVLERIARDARDILARMNDRLDRMDERTKSRIDAPAREHHADNARTNGRVDAMFVSMLGGFASLLGAVAHGFHWI